MNGRNWGTPRARQIQVSRAGFAVRIRVLVTAGVQRNLPAWALFSVGVRSRRDRSVAPSRIRIGRL